MAIRNRTVRTEQQCRYVLRRAGENADGTPLGPTYGGDSPTYCNKPGREEIRPAGRGMGVYVRCAEHAGQ